MVRRTLKEKVELEGFGIHTGKASKIFIHPAANDGGAVIFVKDGKTIKASIENVVDVHLATVLGNGSASVKTVEHLLSALYGLGVTDAVIEVHGEEIPALDGSSAEFVKAIEEAGTEEIDRPAKVLRVVKPFRVEGNGGFIEVLPADGRLEIECVISYDHPYLSFQKQSFSLEPETYKREIAPARTFCFYEQIAHLLRSGKGRGGNDRIVVVIGKDGIINKPARFEDEPVRHKILDLIGDLSLSGYRIWGKIRAYKSGHALHSKFLKEFLRSDAYKVL